MNNHTRKQMCFYHKPKEEDTLKFRFHPYFGEEKRPRLLKSEGNISPNRVQSVK